MKNYRKKIFSYYLFKEWQRKSYSVFNSLTKVIKICVLLVTYSLLNRCNSVYSQSDTTEPMPFKQIEEVEIIGQRSPGVYPFSIRSIDLINNEEIKTSTALSFDKLLDYHSSIDLKQRGVFDVQSDISIRGGTFDHSLVMINGINLTDPQTGHLNLDLFLDPDVIKRIEVLKGSASRIYGSNAFTGVVNFVTSPDESNYLKIKSYYGNYDLLNYLLSANFNVRNSSHFISYSHKICDGYTHNTDFNIHNFFHHSVFRVLNSKIDLQTGYQDKKFGANGFYSPKYPDQYEEGKVHFSSIKFSTGNKIKFISSIYWRRKNDHYVLIRNNPLVYQNFHMTDIYGSQFNISFDNKFGKTSLGLNIRNESILSNRLGYDLPRPIKVVGFDSIFYTKQFNRTISDLFFEHGYKYEKFTILGGFLVNHSSDYPYKYRFFPGIDISYKLSKFFNFTFSWNYSVHLPTFTDLFYSDPTNQGNLLLNPAQLNSFEMNIESNAKKIYSLISFFYQKGDNVIEWLWSWNNSRYRPVNLENFISRGFETSFQVKNLANFINYIRGDYTFLDVYKSIDDTSILKYNNIKNKFTFSLNHNLVQIKKKFLATCSWSFKYVDRDGYYLLYDFENAKYYQKNYKPYYVADFKLDMNYKSISLYFIISNIFNKKYIEMGAIEQPGRWFNIGMQYILK